MHLPTNDEDLLHFLLNLHDRHADFMSEQRRAWLSYYKQLRSYINKDDYPFKFSIFIPWVWGMHQTVMPRMVAGLMYRTPLVEGRRTHPSTSQEQVNKATALLNNSWMTDEKTWSSVLMGIQEGLMYGTSFLYMDWFTQYQQVPTWGDPIMLDGIPSISIKTMQEVCVENRPRLIHRDVFDIVPDMLNGQDPQFIIDVVIKSADEIVNGPVDYDDVSDVEDMADYNINLDGDFRFERMSAIELNYPDFLGFFDKPRHLMNFTIRCHTKDGLEIRLITIINRKKIIRDKVIPMWPWYVYRNYPLPHEMLGVSEIEAVESLQHGYNAQFNMLMENLLMSMTKMWMFGDGADADIDSIVLEPGGVIQVSDISQVQEVKFSDINSKSFDVAKMFQEFMSQAVGVNDYMRGANPPRKEFATTVMALQQASEARIDMKIKLADKYFISPIAKGMIEMAQHELEDPIYAYNKDMDDFEEIHPRDIQGLMDFKVNASSMGVSEVARQQLVEFTQVLSQLLGPETPPQTRVELAAEIATTFQNERITEIMRETVQLVGQASQQQQGAGQGAQGQPPQGKGTPVPGTNGAPSVGGLKQAITQTQGPLATPGTTTQ